MAKLDLDFCTKKANFPLQMFTQMAALQLSCAVISLCWTKVAMLLFRLFMTKRLLGQRYRELLLFTRSVWNDGLKLNLSREPLELESCVKLLFTKQLKCIPFGCFADSRSLCGHMTIACPNSTQYFLILSSSIPGADLPQILFARIFQEKNTTWERLKGSPVEKTHDLS